MADETKVVESTVEEIVVKRRGFDLDKFERVSLEGTVKFTPLTRANFMQEALAICDGDQDKLYSLVNSAARRGAIVNSRAGIAIPDSMPNWIPSAKAVLGFVNTFRGMNPYSKFPDTKAGRKDQTAAIIAFLKSQPALIESLKMLALAAAGSGDEEEEDEVTE